MIDPSNIKVIAFDLGNVLLPFSRWKAVFNLARVSAVSPIRVAWYFLITKIWLEFDKGRYTIDEFYSHVNQELRLDISKEDFYEAYADIFDENWSVIHLLPKLKKRFRLLLISDINPLHVEYLKRKYDFFSHFHRFIASCEVKAMKPSRESFQILIEAGGAKPHETIFIDDRKCNVEGAKRMGIHTVHFRNEKQFLSEFCKLGFLDGVH
jgi:putative hydrolase of the HAD superfamily